MINGLRGDSYIVVGGDGGDTSLPYVPMNHENPIQGMMRVWGSTIQVFNGSGWSTMPLSYSTVGINPVYQQAINWALAKMTQEQQMKALAEQHPAIADLVAAVDKAQEQLQMTAALVKI
jgi:hypothetical protein